MTFFRGVNKDELSGGFSVGIALFLILTFSSCILFWGKLEETRSKHIEKSSDQFYEGLKISNSEIEKEWLNEAH